jgi:hypothetical protein
MAEYATLSRRERCSLAAIVERSERNPMCAKQIASHVKNICEPCEVQLKLEESCRNAHAISHVCLLHDVGGRSRISL